jgi:mono/diheme cytochrome c family protein
MAATQLWLGVGLGLVGASLTVGLATAAPAAKALAGGEATVSASKSAAPAAVDFDRDVRPILAENCFACHGFDANKRQASLRLDQAEGAFGKLPSGSVPVVPGKPAQSALVQRVRSHTMPPPGFRKKLTQTQIDLLTRWVAQGGRYAAHWAFVAPRTPELPAVGNRAWVQNPIDRFVLARLEREGLHPSAPADRTTLIRRVTLDLTGLPAPLRR